MTQSKRYSAEEMLRYAKSLDERPECQAMLVQASETEVKVMGLVEVLERVESIAGDEVESFEIIVDSVHRIAREALSKFRGE